MRHKLPFGKILLIVALLLPFFALKAQNNSDTITSVYPNPTSTSVLAGFYAYHLSACLYTADEINHPAGNIYSFSYNIAPSNGYFHDFSNAKIYLVETDDDAINLEQTWSDITDNATLVYNGSLESIIPFDTYWHEFTFVEPFEYNGGNLMVLVEGVFDDGTGVGGTNYEIGLYCNEGNANNCWIVMRDDEQFSFDENLSELSGSHHDNTENRPDIFFSFSNSPQNCVLSIPYFDDFQSYDGNYSSLPTCWTRISEEYNEYLNYYTPIVGPGSASDNYNQNLFFSLMDTYSEYAVLPKLENDYNVQNLTMTLKFKTNQQYTNAVMVGVMTDPADTNTFVAVDTIFREGNVFDFENKEINFASYNGTGRYIALCFSRSVSTSMYPSCFIDDINIEESAFCTAPVQISSSVQGDDVTISWTYTNNAQGVKLYYKTTEETDYEMEEIDDVNTYTLNNLPLGTTYQYYLVTVCGEDEESDPSQILTFTTECETITEFTWIEGFEDGISCWQVGGSSAGQTWNLVSEGNHIDFANSAYFPFAGNYMMQFNAFNYTYGGFGTLISPKIDLSENRTLSFMYHTFGEQTVFDFDMFEEYPDDQDMWWNPAEERVEVYISSDATLENATLLTTVNGYSNSVGWQNETITIPAQEEDFSYIIFKAIYAGGYNMAIDNVLISEFGGDYEPVFITIDTFTCQGNNITINESEYSLSGTYQITISHEDDADTIITLNLTVNPTYSITFEETINEGETYYNHGFNANATGVYTQNLQTVNGCDSILTLNLTVVGETPNPVTITVDTTVCQGEIVVLGGNEYSTSGNYSFESNDTTYSLSLVVNPTYNIVINDSLEEGKTYTNYGFNVSTAGTYTQNLQTVNGCDSIVTLELSSFVGINDYNKLVFSVAPNPAKDFFIVNIESINSDVKLELSDISGRVLRSELITNGENSIRVERGNLPSGIYMLRLSCEGQHQTRKLILR